VLADFKHHLRRTPHIEMQRRNANRLSAADVADLIVDEQRLFRRGLRASSPS
jgi:hypothetical protein